MIHIMIMKNALSVENQEKSERIICAAIWYNDGIKRSHLPRNIDSGIVAAGWRHHNCFTILWTLYPDRDYISCDQKTIQGFLTSKGNFVDRKEAFIIAKEQGQIIEEEFEKSIRKDELKSELIY